MATQSLNSFNTRTKLKVGDRSYTIFSLKKLESGGNKNSHLPYSLRILLENLLRHEDGRAVETSDIKALVNWDPNAAPETEISFMPARVILQDFTGVPAVVDLAAMRDSMAEMGGKPSNISPLLPAELVIDHSVQVDEYGSDAAFLINEKKDYERNGERYALLRWGQKAFDGFRVVPPATGIVHQVNLEYLGRVVFPAEDKESGLTLAYPDTLVGTDSHTTMINGLGVLGWGVGGIEAEAAVLGQPIPMLIPQVVGFKLHGNLPEGATATDLVLTVTEMLREKGVVGKFVEFYGEGLPKLSLADRATIGNMSPEFGSTCAIFPIDEETLAYLRLSGRSDEQVELVEAYAREQGIFHTADSPEPTYSDTLALDLSTVRPSIAGPKRPQDRIPLDEALPNFKKVLPGLADASKKGGQQLKQDMAWEGGRTPGGCPQGAAGPATKVNHDGKEFVLNHGSVVIAAITSCTNTSNPSVMLGAGLVAKKAVELGLDVKPWVKTSLAPGSKVVTDYLTKSELLPYLEKLKFHVVGYGCTTCIGNSGPLAEPIHNAIQENQIVAVSVLSGNRNFEGRINPDVRANYLMSPPLVVAYALAGRMDIDIVNEPIGQSKDGKDVFLKDLWPSQTEVREAVRSAVDPEMFKKQYANVFDGDERWRALPIPEGEVFEWDKESTYIRRPTFLKNIPINPPEPTDIENARALAVLGDSVTTDHISPAGSIAKDSPAGKYLIEHGVEYKDFNSYGSRRGNHEVMMRGTFANIRLRNQLAPGTEGGWTRFQPEDEQMTIFDAAVKYEENNVPLIVIAGKEYGSGSSRDWAAKGTKMLGVRAVIARSYERIHRSNLIGMGVLPLQFTEDESCESLKLDGKESFSITGISEDLSPGKSLTVTAKSESGEEKSFEVLCRIDTPVELDYYRHGGILPFVLRQRL